MMGCGLRLGVRMEVEYICLVVIFLADGYLAAAIDSYRS